MGEINVYRKKISIINKKKYCLPFNVSKPEMKFEKKNN